MPVASLPPTIQVTSAVSHQSSDEASVAQSAADPAARNKRTVRRLYEECFNQGNSALVAELVAAEFIGGQGERGPAGFAGTIAGLRGAFPDIHFAVEELIAEGERIAVRWTWRGTHAAPFQGFAATHKPVTNTGIVIFHLRDGQLVSARNEVDRLGVLQQLGIIARPATSGD